MMRQKTVTISQIRRIDRMAIERFGVPSLALMENAGVAVAKETLRQLKKEEHNRVTILCGMGNNAGDGFVAARHLINAGAVVHIYVLGPTTRLQNDARINFLILKKCGVKTFLISRSKSRLKRSLRQSGVIIDALFGVGLNRELNNSTKKMIEEINALKIKVMAVDIPSGLDGTTGSIYGACIKANTTVTFSLAKKGMYLKDGPRYSGLIQVVDIGIPKHILSKIV